VAFLLGVKGESRASKTSRDEHGVREPTLQTALAYEAIYGRPVRELFAGMYEQAEREVTGRAKLLTYRTGKSNPKRHATLTNLASKVTV
jgi:transcriptional regulator with XRE-family HTH domain